jgi:hypothetical protein
VDSEWQIDRERGPKPQRKRPLALVATESNFINCVHAQSIPLVWALLGLGVLSMFQKVTRAGENRYGFFDLLDNRSRYNTNFYPEPLNTDEMDADQELRLNYAHFENRRSRSDGVSAEMEKTFGQLTLELEVPWEHEAETEDGATDNSDGVGNVEIAARHPIYQFVSQSGWFDYTLGANAELAVATGSDVSKKTEVVIGLYQTMAFDEHLTLQTRAAYSTTMKPFFKQA